MKKLANDKGITLLALVITIIILIILAAIAIPAGRDTIESAKLTTFETEIQTMQRKVNELAQKMDSKDQNSVLQVQNLGNSLTGTDEEAKAFAGAEINDRSGYKYYSKEVLSELGFPNFKNEFLVNVEKRSVIGLTGAKYKGLTLYTVDQLQNDLYNVDYEGVQSVATFDVTSEENKLIVSNIKYIGDVKKGTIYYGQGDNENSVEWKIAKTNTTDNSCNIDVVNEGNWYVKIVDSAGNESMTKSEQVVMSRLTIAREPQDAHVIVGQTATFTTEVTATGKGSVAYQWYKSNSSAPGTVIGGATNNSYTTPATTLADNNTYYYCEVTQTNGSYQKKLSTKYAKLSISGESITPVITLSSANGTVEYNGTTTFTATSSSTPAIDGTWQVVSSNPDVIEIIEGNNATATNGSPVNITYKAKQVTSEPVTITITFTPNDTTNYKTVTNTYTVNGVNKIDATPQVNMTGYTYGGQKSTPSISGNDGNGEVTYYYNTTNSTTGGTNWNTVETSTSLPVGKYYMYATIGETANYNAVTTATVEFTITKATANITLSATSGAVNYNAEGTFTATASEAGTLQVRSGEENVKYASDLREGEHVIYTDKNGNEIPCIVLYDSTGDYGIQVISADTVGSNIQLGNGTGSSSATGNAIYFETAKESYNTVISTLNNAAGGYLNTNLATSARSVGSSPSETAITMETDTGTYTNNRSYFSLYNNQFKSYSVNNTNSTNEDWLKMNTLSCHNISKVYWLASRDVGASSNYTGFRVRYVEASGDFSGQEYLCFVGSIGNNGSRSYARGLRPVFTIKPNVKVVNGRLVASDENHATTILSGTGDTGTKSLTATKNTATEIRYKGVAATTEATTITVKFIPTDTTNYEETTATYTVNTVNKIQATAPVLGNTTCSYDGHAHAVSMTSSGDGGT